MDLDELRALLADDPDRPVQGAVPSADELARWAAGELSEGERAQLLERIAASPKGIALWRAVDDLVREAEGLPRRLDEPASPRRHLVPAPDPSWTMRRPRWLRLARVAAAVALVGSLGALGWRAHTRLRALEDANARLAEAARRAPGQEGVELLSSDLPTLDLAIMRGDEPVPQARLVLPPAGDVVPMVIRLPGRGLSAVELGLFDQQGARWTARVDVPPALAAGGEPTLLVRLPRPALSPPGRYHLAVVQRGTDERLFQIDLEVLAGPSEMP